MLSSVGNRRVFNREFFFVFVTWNYNFSFDLFWVERDILGIIVKKLQCLGSHWLRRQRVNNQNWRKKEKRQKLGGAIFDVRHSESPSPLRRSFKRKRDLLDVLHNIYMRDGRVFWESKNINHPKWCVSWKNRRDKTVYNGLRYGLESPASRGKFNVSLARNVRVDIRMSIHFIFTQKNQLRIFVRQCESEDPKNRSIYYCPNIPRIFYQIFPLLSSHRLQQVLSNFLLFFFFFLEKYSANISSDFSNIFVKFCSSFSRPIFHFFSHFYVRKRWFEK